ncbi:MAG TPA: alpha/beta fold hydrolase [Mycobacteriales bacterium]|nr:alpha/beta fold hydrolase [Mycobacteriales bacterium]
MKADEARDLGRLAAVALGGGTRRIAEVHSGIAGRVFSTVGPVATPVRAVHDGVTRVVYTGVRAGLYGAARAAGQVSSLLVDGEPLDSRPRARVALAIVNGAHGDAVARVAPALSLDMTVRREGADVPLDRASLARAFPAARSTVVVFLHGLTENEGAWCYRSLAHHGRPQVTFGSLLERDLGCTAVFLRYGTGLHISDNGRRLDALLRRLVDAWPVEVRDLVLVGHSMGGLVARSALHVAGGGTPAAQPWTRLVRDTVTLGTPHAGAPLERGVHRLAGALHRLPETRPVAALLATRSVGIKDLRHGTLVEDDWSGHDPDAPERGPHTLVPLHDGARHFAVLTTIARDPSSRLGRLLGDGLVTPDSAVGEGALAFPADHVHRLGGLHHFDLLSEPRVYDQLLAWLRDRPAPADDPAAS